MSLLTASSIIAAEPPAASGTGSAVRPSVGSDRDAHGCIPSAGYTWSEVHASCIRLFESGLAFEPESTSKASPVQLACIVLAPAQGGEVTAAELFAPGVKHAIPLTLVRNPEGDPRPILLVNKAQGVRVLRAKDDHILENKGQRYRRSSPPSDRLFELR